MVIGVPPKSLGLSATLVLVLVLVLALALALAFAAVGCVDLLLFKVLPASIANLF
ncbi:hypothetical protein FACS1894152_0420 [Bacilli bacterium]|nr:hypothetical protein FACS1894152_0380 [Bacilli bacterium]GHU26237.1 hypothetical protein FACS1894152_0420 [Bacilli bacterium]